MDPFIGEIRLFAGNFPPRGWAFCQGQLLPISQNQALFSLLGTIYGGDGRTNFALPDLRGRAPIGFGQGPELSNYPQGQRGGSETVTLNSLEIPPHNHSLSVNGAPGTTADPTNAVPAVSAARDNQYAATGDTIMNSAAVGNTGGGQAHENRSPYLSLNYIIALQGIFPSRN